MIGTYHIDDLDGAVTLFKSTDEGTETIAVFDEEHREVIQELLEKMKWLTDKLFEAETHIDPLTDDYTFENDVRELHYIEEGEEE